MNLVAQVKSEYHNQADYESGSIFATPCVRRTSLPEINHNIGMKSGSADKIQKSLNENVRQKPNLRYSSEITGMPSNLKKMTSVNAIKLSSGRTLPKRSTFSKFQTLNIDTVPGSRRRKLSAPVNTYCMS